MYTEPQICNKSSQSLLIPKHHSTVMRRKMKPERIFFFLSFGWYGGRLVVPEDLLICGNTFKKVFKNSVRAPLATGSWLQAAVEGTNVSMMELLLLTVTVSVGEVVGGWARMFEAIVAWWGEGSGCPERCGRALSKLLTDTGDKTSGWRGEAAVPEQEDGQEGRHLEINYQQRPVNAPSTIFITTHRHSQNYKTVTAHPQHVHSVVVRTEVLTERHQKLTHLWKTNTF